RGAEAVFNQGQHDDGEKTVLGQTGRWKGEDVVRICLEQKAAAPFIAAKLYRFLVSESVPATPELLGPLAERFRTSGYDFGALVRTVLSSNLFFAPAAYRTRVKAPVDFALGIVRALEGRIGTSALALALDGLGQKVFYPPNVKGWDGGQAWLNGQTLLFRQNLALALTSTEDPRFGSRTDPGALVRKYGPKSDTEVVDFFLRLFLQGDVPAPTRARLLDYQRRSHDLKAPVYWTAADAAGHRVRALCHLVLSWRGPLVDWQGGRGGGVRPLSGRQRGAAPPRSPDSEVSHDRRPSRLPQDVPGFRGRGELGAERAGLREPDRGRRPRRRQARGQGHHPRRHRAQRRPRRPQHRPPPHGPRTPPHSAPP